MDIVLPDVDTTILKDGRTAALLGNHVAVRGVGDQLVLTALAREFHNAYPSIPITMATLGGKEAFENSPYINEVVHGLIRHGIDRGAGHYIQRKCRYFNIHEPEIRGQLFFTEKELRIARETFTLLCGEKPAVVFCMNSTDNRRNWTTACWEDIIMGMSHDYDFFQVEQSVHYHRFEPDNPDDGRPCLYKTVPSARQELRNLGLRHIMALQAVCGRYLGSNTGFYHIAQAISPEGNACFMHRDFGGNDEWIYKDAFNFWAHENWESNLSGLMDKLDERWGS